MTSRIRYGFRSQNRHIRNNGSVRKWARELDMLSQIGCQRGFGRNKVRLAFCRFPHDIRFARLIEHSGLSLFALPSPEAGAPRLELLSRHLACTVPLVGFAQALVLLLRDGRVFRRPTG